jgi:hypothetical protein
MGGLEARIRKLEVRTGPDTCLTCGVGDTQQRLAIVNADEAGPPSCPACGRGPIIVRVRIVPDRALPDSTTWYGGTA